MEKELSRKLKLVKKKLANAKRTRTQEQIRRSNAKRTRTKEQIHQSNSRRSPVARKRESARYYRMNKERIRARRIAKRKEAVLSDDNHDRAKLSLSHEVMPLEDLPPGQDSNRGKNRIFLKMQSRKSRQQ